MFRIRTGQLLVFSAALITSGCSDDAINNPHSCPHTQLNSNLNEVLYWGELDQDPCTYLANRGFQVASVYLPRWTSNDAILTVSNFLRNCEAEYGMIRVNVDPTTHAFVSVTHFVYNGRIWIQGYDWLQDTQEAVLLFSENTPAAGIATARLENGHLLVGPRLVADWSPTGVSRWPGHEGYVFYGTDPANSVSGFYWMRGDDAIPDSLVLEVADSLVDARSFDFSPDGSLLYAASSYRVSYPDSCALREYNLVSHVSTQLFKGRGAFAALDASPDGSRVLLNRRYDGDSVNPPEDYIDIIDLATGKASRVDVRTNECTWAFIVALNPAWSDDGHAFAFLGGWASGEGDYAPYKLWVRELSR